MSPYAGGKRAVIYCRQSLDATGAGAAVERQEEACRGLAVARGWDVVAVKIDNSISASTGKARPAWAEVRAMIDARQVDVVIAWHFDRIARTMNDLEALILITKDSGVGIATATGDIDLTNDMGRMVARILAAVASGEVERKAARQRAQQVQRRAHGGHWWSQRPFGYEWEPGCEEITLRESEAGLIREGYDMLDRGSTYVSVCERWNGAGSVTTKGKAWTPVTVRQLLHNRRNAGQVVHDGKVAGKGNWPAIIEPARLDAILGIAGTPVMRGRTTGKRKAVLSGLAHCGTCGLPLQQRTRGSKARGAQKIYRPKCGHVSAPVEWLDDYISWCVANALASPFKPKARSHSALSADDQARLDRLTRKQGDIDTMFMEDRISAEQHTAMSSTVQEELRPLQQAEAAIHRYDPIRDAEFTSILHNWNAGTLDLAERRGVVSGLFSDIVVQPRRPGKAMSPADVVVLDGDGDVFEMDLVELHYGKPSGVQVGP